MTEIDFNKIDPQALIAKVRELATDRPDFVGNYSYTEYGGKPGCIFGHAFSVMGINIPFTSEYNIMSIGCLGIPFSTEEAVLCTAIQNYQDNGMSWGEAWNESIL